MTLDEDVKKAVEVMRQGGARPCAALCARSAGCGLGSDGTDRQASDDYF